LNGQNSEISERKARKSSLNKYKKEKSLGIFCQQFISLFVTWKKVISLEEAARQISDEEETLDEQRLKTKIRRLYDIANVLQSIGLIHKTQKSLCRKPAFSWIGIESVR
jgi:transcription factor E2F7/8